MTTKKKNSLSDGFSQFRHLGRNFLKLGAYDDILSSRILCFAAGMRLMTDQTKREALTLVR